MNNVSVRVLSELCLLIRADGVIVLGYIDKQTMDSGLLFTNRQWVSMEKGKFCLGNESNSFVFSDFLSFFFHSNDEFYFLITSLV